MDALRRAASRFLIGFEGPDLSPGLKDLLDLGVSGVILFRRNIVDLPQVAGVVADLRRYAGRPLFVCVDQEGGPVQRLRAPFTELPAAGVLGAVGDERLTARLAAMMARELSALGINVDFAPVADVNTNPANPVIGVRSFGADPGVVSRQAAAWIRGMQAAGVMACAKHFPGHGDTSVDSHLDLPVVEHDLRRMKAVELPPFQAAIRAGVGSIMTAHVVFKRLDPLRSATLSPKVLGGLLRRKMGFKGLIMSDDLEMKAIADRVGIPEAAAASLKAGADLLLVCRSLELARVAIQKVAAMRLSPLTDRRLAAALRKWPGKVPHLVHALRTIGRPAHRALAAQLARRAAEVGMAWEPPSPVTRSPVSLT